MQIKEKRNIVFIRLFPGEIVNREILNVCRKHDISSGVIISGIGQLENIELGYFKSKGNYSPMVFEKPMEILSLSGNICKVDDEYIPHLHITLSNDKMHVFGGHFINGIVTVTAEIVILKTSVNFSRKQDEETGLKQMVL
jgi:predicted DNA-binding protein with PD1-like motif